MIEGRATSRPTAVIAATEILTDMRVASAGGESAAMGASGLFGWERVATAPV